jgi:4-hydroxybenzoate polyprenyltransferase
MCSEPPLDRPWPVWIAVLKIAKVPFWFIWLTPFVYGYLMSAGDSAPTQLGWFLFSVCGVCLLESANCIHNELVDQEEDRINQPNRSTLIQSVGESVLWKMVIVGYLAVLMGITAIAVFVRPTVAILMLLAVIAAPLYNWGPRFKRRPYLAEVAIGWSTLFGFLAGWFWRSGDVGVPPVAWVVTYFFAVTSLMKDLPDVRGDETVQAPGIFSIKRSILRRALLIFIYASPYVLILILITVGAMPPRLLLLFVLAIGGFLTMGLTDRVSSIDTLIVAYELAFLYVHLFMLGLFVLVQPSPLSIAVASILFFARLGSLALQLAPRFVEPQFSWNRAINRLLTSNS